MRAAKPPNEKSESLRKYRLQEYRTRIFGIAVSKGRNSEFKKRDTRILQDGGPTRLSNNSLLEKSSQKSPTTGSKIAEMLFGRQKQGAFQCFVPLSKDQFSKRDFFDSFNGARYASSGHRWAGVDSVWEQRKLEVRKMLLEAADSQKSAARFDGLFFIGSMICIKPYCEQN